MHDSRPLLLVLLFPLCQDFGLRCRGLPPTGIPPTLGLKSTVLERGQGKRGRSSDSSGQNACPSYRCGRSPLRRHESLQ